MPEYNEENLEKAARRLRIRLIANRKQLHAPALRPHTWIFLRDNDGESVLCLGIVFHVWPRNKYNMIRFTAKTDAGMDISTSGRLTKLDNGKDGLVLDLRWPWETLLKQYKGLSAGNL